MTRKEVKDRLDILGYTCVNGPMKNHYGCDMLIHKNGEHICTLNFYKRKVTLDGIQCTKQMLYGVLKDIEEKQLKDNLKKINYGIQMS